MSVKRVKKLLERLNDHCADMLDDAAGFAMARTHYEVTIEHVVIKCLEDGSGDMARLFRAFNVDSDTIWQGMLQQLSSCRAGNTGKPSFSPLVLDWFEQAWVNASLHFNHEQIRSGALLDALIELAPRLPGNHFSHLDGISLDALRDNFNQLVEGSSENMNQHKPVTSKDTKQAGTGTSTQASENGGALSQFTIDVTARAASGEIDPVFGRDNEIRQMVDVLSRRRKNNPILVGEPGVGKTALVEGLALRMVEGQVPDNLKNIGLNILDLGLLQAGAGVKGEFEKRLKQVIDEVKESTTPIILFIDEAHTLIGAGGDAGGSDAANLLKPALARGELRTIAATTWSEYKQYFERDAALARRFQLVKVEEPDVENAITMISGLKAYYQRHHEVLITDDAIKAAVHLSNRYITGRQLPDKAIDLIDTAAARVRMGQASPPVEVETAEAELAHIKRRLGHLDEERAQGIEPEKEIINDLNDRKQKIQTQLAETKLQWQIELALVKKLDEQRKQLLESGLDKEEADQQLDDEKEKLANEMREILTKSRQEIQQAQSGDVLVHSEVTADVIASVISDWTGIPVGNMVHDLASTLLRFEEILGDRVVGQDQAMTKLGKTLRTRTAGLTREDAPMGVFLLVGPSGVGKTETARAIAEILFGGERFLTTINMSEYQESHTVSQLKGSPPGYVGYGEGGILTEAVRQRPYSVVLLDEVEKAHPDVMNLFFQVFDRGFMRDGEGREIDFSNTVILMTSNLAASEIMDSWQKHQEESGSDEATEATETKTKKSKTKASKKKPAKAENNEENKKPLSIDQLEAEIQPQLLEFFPQALLARMQVIPFLPLDTQTLEQIAALKLDKVAERLLANHKIQFQCMPEVLKHLASLCQRPELGARHIDAIIDRKLLPNVARTLLNYMLDDDTPDILRLGLDENNELICDFLELSSEPAQDAKPEIDSKEQASATV
ncbi:MAG: type VI secretion system ATPase TssH [Acidiferrobacterales bacterium]